MEIKILIQHVHSLNCIVSTTHFRTNKMKLNLKAQVDSQIFAKKMLLILVKLMNISHLMEYQKIKSCQKRKTNRMNLFK
jgi:hypothetical protein